MFIKRTNLQNYVEYYLLKVSIFMVYLLGRSFANFLGEILIFVFYYFIPIRKKQVLENIALSFPEKTKKQINRIAKNTYRTFMKVFIDMFFISKMPDSKIEKMLIYDEEMIGKTLAKGKGLVLLSAHFGNWELSALAFAKRYTVATIVSKQSNAFIDKMLNGFRNRKGFNIIDFNRDDKISFRHIVKALRKNQVFAILGDQDAGHEGIFLPFFGRLVSTPRGPAFFALRAGSPIFTAFGVRQEDGSMKMKIEELAMPNTGDDEKDIEIINSIYNKRLEEVIRENPDQWFWFHRRWNTRPKK
ncbi:MAG: lysophospholipid acyltransferase family protein [Endomicrobium sp.]|jgi:KDO2-lipid IV(A) lauroyltransferase|nr:lysophospholipid acyltransferase family protein [Endomicrobium sp.]